MYNDFRNQFGRDEKIIVAIKTKDVFNKNFLEKLFKLHNEIEESVPHIKTVEDLTKSIIDILQPTQTTEESSDPSSFSVYA